MSKIAIAKGTLIIVILIAVLISSAVAAGVSIMVGNSPNSQDTAGPQGPIGNTGATGSQGPKGDTGAVGATGPEGSTGATGAAGPIGAQGVQGPQGATGPAGPTGAQGPYLPDYDSGWINITSKQGQTITVTHNLNYDNVLVDITGRTTASGSIHQRYLGLTGSLPGWNKTYGGTNDDFGHSAIQTKDGGYTIIGETYSFGAGGDDVYLVKTDLLGNLVWNKTFGGAANDYGTSVVQALDGGYVITGATASFGAGSYDVYLVKTDSSGNLVWSKTFGGALGEVGYSVIQTSDGGYAITGTTASFGAGSSDLYLVKTDSSGNLVWSKTFGGALAEIGYSVTQTLDGGYAIAGQTASLGAGSYDVYLVKTDSLGNLVWSKTFGGTGLDLGFAVVQTSDGGYAISGGTTSFGAGSSDLYLVKTDASGNLVWSKTFGGADYDIGGYSVVQTSDGGYAIVGITRSFGAGNYDVYLVKTDSLGNLVWSKTFGGADYDYGNSVVQTSDGGYAIAGITFSFGAGESVYLVKTDVNGDFGLARVDSSANTLTLYRGVNDVYWNYVRVQIWKID